jgi:hypothetical protein
MTPVTLYSCRVKDPAPAGFTARWAGFAAMLVLGSAAMADNARFRKDIHPILTEYCYDCHGDGMEKGNVAFDGFASDEALLADRTLWLQVLKNLQTRTMPPEKKERPSDRQIARLESWIKSDVFQIDPKNPDPGRVTVRRLNRAEYRNTVRDLMGVDYDTKEEFPPDDSGYGFDNISDVLTLPPMLLEKYLDAAKDIVTRVVPLVERVAPETIIGKFEGEGTWGTSLSYYEKNAVTNRFNMAHAGRYKVVLDLRANEKFVDNVFDLNKCRLTFRLDGEVLLTKEFNREGNLPFLFDFDRECAAGGHEMSFEVEPLTSEKQVRALKLRINQVAFTGPLDDRKTWVRPKGFERFFTKDAPTDAEGRRAYARELLGNFATKAFRRPIDPATAEKLASLAQTVYDAPGKTFEAGMAHAMVAVLASPRFLFREEAPAPALVDGRFPFVDEHSLASRLSYFLWSTMPDDELRRLADEGKLRATLPAQIQRMLKDKRSYAFVQNFAGQWLLARDIETVPIDSGVVVRRDESRDSEFEAKQKRLSALRKRQNGDLTKEEQAEFDTLLAEVRQVVRRKRPELNGDLRRAMRAETEKYFEHVMRDDRPLVELIDSDYTYLNERLAQHYGMSNVLGDDFRLVKLPPDSPRGGVLTMGTILATTSNPTRTSPVKRGVFILDHLLGAPPPPPPPNIPPLENTESANKGRELTLRETLELHRAKPLCSSCHNRMDPLGLALENFNAIGMWRDTERQQPVEPAGRLISGESFQDIRGLKKILATTHAEDFRRCLTEKLLTYALGRGLEYYDVATVDSIVDRIAKEDGKFSALMLGIIESAPFQRTRTDRSTVSLPRPEPAQLRAQLKSTP